MAFSKSSYYLVGGLGAVALLLLSTVKSSAMTLSYLGDASLPLGLRNNNPTNLRLTSIPWLGKIPNAQNTDGSFEQFNLFVYGLRAGIKNFQSDIESGKNTITDLINENSPPFENDTQGYIDLVVMDSGIPSNKILSSLDKDSLYKILKSVCQVENGQDVITWDLFNFAWNLI